MFKLNPSDPAVVTTSLFCYHLLLRFFPKGFRNEYGYQMVQVFRDCCLSTYRRSGLKGMLPFWAHTLFDWLKILIEERSNQETEMSGNKLIRLSGWGLMVGPLALFIGLGDPAQYRSLLYDIFGLPTNQEGITAYQFTSETLPLFILLSGLGLILFGSWGLYMNYREKAGRLGRFGLRLVTWSAGLSAIGGALSLTGSGIWWIAFLLGLLSFFIFLTLFGVTALWDRPFSRWNALPLAAGGWFLGIIGLGLALGWQEIPYFMILPMLFALLGLSLIGFLLQSDATTPALTKVNKVEQL